MATPKNICWIRRDLRLQDHQALSQALLQGPTLLVFVFDTSILNKLTQKNDQRLSFIYDSLQELELELNQRGSSLKIIYGDPVEAIPQLAQELKVSKVFCNRDYEPAAKLRDQKIAQALAKQGVAFHSYKDSVIFEKDEVLTKSQTPFKVFTPYKNRWLEVFSETQQIKTQYTCQLEQLFQWQNPQSINHFDWYKEIGFVPTPPTLPAGRTAALGRLEEFKKIISSYHIDRDFPALEGTSLLSVYLRHGNISVREMVRLSLSKKDEGHKVWLSEIIWRDFYQTVLDVYPHVTQGSFKKEYDKIKFIGSNKNFLLWTQGQTGFPLIDAAMRCFLQTGLMHNRLRMVCASFLCKTLLVDWRKGEAYFAEKLLDFDLAANNGGWQWSSSSGCDAQPYFRIFNPYLQSKKFDPDGDFIRSWVPELAHLNATDIHRPTKEKAPEYPEPIVSYEAQRTECLKMYSVIKDLN